MRVLDRAVPDNKSSPAHLLTGRQGEEDAYFYLRRKGYMMVARNYRTARHHGEIDLIAWDKDVLCFIEVKTRTTRDVKPAEAAVDRKKRHDLGIMIRDYLRSLPAKTFPELPQWRFDVVSVYYEEQTVASRTGDSQRERSEVTHPGLAKSARPGAPPGAKGSNSRTIRPTFELFQNATLSS